jgi:hypothetical protein
MKPSLLELAEPCTMGVGCDEAGICYAAAHGQPERCPKNKSAALRASNKEQEQ